MAQWQNNKPHRANERKSIYLRVADARIDLQQSVHKRNVQPVLMQIFEFLFSNIPLCFAKTILRFFCNKDILFIVQKYTFIVFQLLFFYLLLSFFLIFAYGIWWPAYVITFYEFYIPWCLDKNELNNLILISLYHFLFIL